MDNKIKRLPDAELEVMKAVWAAREPVTRAQLEQLLGSKKQWAPTTILAHAHPAGAEGLSGTGKAGPGLSDPARW